MDTQCHATWKRIIWTRGWWEKVESEHHVPTNFSNRLKGSVMWFRHAVWNMISQFYLKGRKRKSERRVLTWVVCLSFPISIAYSFRFFPGGQKVKTKISYELIYNNSLKTSKGSGLSSACCILTIWHCDPGWSVIAVDAYVGKYILDHCLLDGPLANRTRILVTHSLHILDKVDYIYVMDNGAIIEQGTYSVRVDCVNETTFFYL